MVKKTLIYLLLAVALITLPIAFALGMTNSVQNRPTADWFSGATDSGKDVALLWAREVEDILEGTVAGQKVLVEEVTAQTNVLTAGETGTVYQITYNGNHTSTLPDAAAGLYYTFIDAAAGAGYDVIIDCQSGDNIDADTNGDAIESVTDAVGQAVTLIAINGTDWHIINLSGTWSQQ